MNARRIASLAAFLFAWPAGAQSPALTRIGGAGAVRGQVNATAPNAAVGRVVESGKPMYFQDHVITKADSHLQVMLLDETVFTMGPGSDLVLDEFVYDPDTGAGKIAARVSKGVFRFVTGKVARREPAAMKVNLAVGTIGIRGTKVAATTDAKSSTIILEGAGDRNNADEPTGRIRVENAGAAVEISRPGYGVTIFPGQPPSAPSDMTQQLAAIIAQLAPRGKAGDADAGKNAGEDSGQRTASAKGPLVDIEDLASLEQEYEATRLRAIQDTQTDRVATWDEVRSFSGGTGLFSGAGTYTCVNGTCGSGTQGPMSFALRIDFGAKQVGGAGSSISLGGILNTATNVNASAFGSSGSAVVFANVVNTNFSGTSFTLINRGGAVAKDTQMKLSFTDTINNHDASGTAFGSR